MRTLSMLLVVISAFLVVRWFMPDSSVDAGNPGADSPAEVSFLALPAGEEEAIQVANAGEATLPLGSKEQRPVPADPTPSWPQSLLAPEHGGGQDEVRAAYALAHGTPTQVEEATAGMEPNRALLLESFAWEMAGERQMALSLSEKIAKEEVQAQERALFEAALVGRARPLDTVSSPVVLAMGLSLLERDARAAVAERRFEEAARAFSELLMRELSAPWQTSRQALERWSNGLRDAQREHRWNPRGKWPSDEVLVQAGDSLIAIRMRHLASHPEARLCTGLIERANRLKGHLQPGQVLRIPTDAARVLVDLDARWALYILGEEVVAAWPVGVGRPGEDTPPGDYTVRNKLENPPWMKEGQEPIPFGDPRNPLGTRWMGWARDGAKTSYGFHGTWEPESIGQAASDGCIRLMNADAEELFQILPEGAAIRVQP